MSTEHEYIIGMKVVGLVPFTFSDEVELLVLEDGAGKKYEVRPDACYATPTLSVIYLETEEELE